MRMTPIRRAAIALTYLAIAYVGMQLAIFAAWIVDAILHY